MAEDNINKHWATLSVIDRGVVVGPSSFGNGLYASRPFQRNNIITEYVGQIISHRTATQLRAEGNASHIRVLDGQHTAIDGIRIPVATVGGASFANHRDSNDIECNAIFVVLDIGRVPAVIRSLLAPRHEKHSIIDYSGHSNNDKSGDAHHECHTTTHCFLRAIKDIAIGSEICVNYGNGYWQLSNEEKNPPTVIAANGATTRARSSLQQTNNSQSSMSSSTETATATSNSSTTATATSVSSSSSISNTAVTTSTTTSTTRTTTTVTTTTVTTTSTSNVTDGNGIASVIAAHRRTTCQTCGKVYRFASQLRRHFNTHVKRTLFACIGCGRAFTDPSNAQRCQRNGCPPKKLNNSVPSTRAHRNYKH